MPSYQQHRKNLSLVHVVLFATLWSIIAEISCRCIAPVTASKIMVFLFCVAKLSHIFIISAVQVEPLYEIVIIERLHSHRWIRSD